jgi:hypothetical protein
VSVFMKSSVAEVEPGEGATDSNGGSELIESRIGDLSNGGDWGPAKGSEIHGRLLWLFSRTSGQNQKWSEL